MSRWRRVFRLDAGPRRVERAVDDEIAFHIDMRTRKLVGQGMSVEAARAKAMEQFGDLATLRDECLAIDYQKERAMQWSERLWAIRQDARYAIRSLRRTPSFTIAVVLLLALGIGANTATFTIIDALMLRELPVAHPEQLVTVGDPAAVTSSWTGTPEYRYVSLPVYLDVRDHNTTLSGLYASGETGLLELAFPGAAPDAIADQPRGRFVTGNYFSVLGIPAFAGRVFSSDEDRVPLDDPVIVISHEYWTREFDGDRSVLGRKILLNGVALTIIGVTPPSFRGDVVGRGTDVWIPMMMEPAIRPQRNAIGNREWSWLQMMGRLATGVTLARARGELGGLVLESIRAHVTGRSLAEFNEDVARQPMRVEAGARGFSDKRESYANALVVLMSAVGLVVLVVCANVSNLMLSRAAARSRELTVRLTLGAGRARLVQQLLTESALVAIAGGALGLLLAAWGSRLLLAIASPKGRSIPLDVSPHPTILAFTAAMTLLCVMLCGLVPAVRASRIDLATSLRAHGRSLMGLHGRLGRVPLVKGLVVGQIAISSVLLVGAGLLVQSMRHILNADLGLDRDRILVVEVGSSRLGYSGARLSSLMSDLADRTRRMPGVTAASYSFDGIFSGGYSSGHVTVPGYVAAADSLHEVGYDEVGPSYFRSIGARILRGRDFESRDLNAGNHVGAINETMAKAYFAGVDPIGRTIEMDSVTYTVTAIVRDIEERNVRAKPVRHLYIPIDPPKDPQSFVLLVHVDGDPMRLVAQIRAALAEINPKLRSDAIPLERLVRASVADDALIAQVTSFFGIVTLLLAGLGLYGVIAYATSQRTSELGLRLALGAEPSRVAGLVVGDALKLAMTGIAIGLPVGLALARLLRQQIFGVGQVDPPSLAVAICLLSMVALIASYAPARRAARVGPLEALRAD